MEALFEKYYRKLQQTVSSFQRSLIGDIDWNNRLIGIKGARGAGKTTLLLQHARQDLPGEGKTLYASLDDLYFTENRLIDLADQFRKEGGHYLLLDEVHRYSNWSQELKNIYDDFADLTIVFTGSSIIHLDRAKGDLSRRAVLYELRGLSFREFLEVTTGNAFSRVTLEELLGKHVDLARAVSGKIRPLEHFKKYLQYGYYPYFLENVETYPLKLAETISLALTSDLPAIHPISYAGIERIRLLLHVIAESVPFKPNISKLSEHTGVARNTLITYLRYLEDLRIIRGLYAAGHGMTMLQKPEKIFLHHPNLIFSLSSSALQADVGSIRESFFINQASAKMPVAYAEQGDFTVGQYTFEVGGRSKKRKQIKHLQDAYVAADGIEIGHQQTIPLWMFGFFY
ncbi:MAG TPA: AAA family ATPase [Puia sp.]|nr:AAA family ATPase [Puia sp.]